MPPLVLLDATPLRGPGRDRSDRAFVRGPLGPEVGPSSRAPAMADGDLRGRRVVVDLRQAGRPGHDETDVAAYQRAVAAGLAMQAIPGDDVWALVAWPAAVDALGAGIAHAGIGHRARRGGARGLRQMLAMLHPDIVVFGQLAPPEVPAPSALVVHDALFATHPEWLGPGEGARTRARTLQAAASARLVIAVSDAARRDLLSVLGPIPVLRGLTPRPRGRCSCPTRTRVRGSRHGGGSIGIAWPSATAVPAAT